MADWSNGICSCFNDCTICFLSFFIPCYQLGKNAEAVGHNCLICGFLSVLGILGLAVRIRVRRKIRQQKGIEGNEFSDCLYAYFCGPCALAQEAQEVQDTGGRSMARE